MGATEPALEQESAKDKNKIEVLGGENNEKVDAPAGESATATSDAPVDATPEVALKQEGKNTDDNKTAVSGCEEDSKLQEAPAEMGAAPAPKPDEKEMRQDEEVEAEVFEFPKGFNWFCGMLPEF